MAFARVENNPDRDAPPLRRVKSVDHERVCESVGRQVD